MAKRQYGNAVVIEKGKAPASKKAFGGKRAAPFVKGGGRSKTHPTPKKKGGR